MRLLTKATLAVALAGVLCHADAIADDTKLEGNWRLIVLAFGEDEFAVFSVKESDGKLSGESVAAQNFLANPSIGGIELKGDQLTVGLVSAGQQNTFSGKRANDGDEPRPFLGTFRFREATYPARIEKTDADKVAPLNRGALPQQVGAATRDPDAKSRVEKLDKLLSENPGKPFLNNAYTAIFQAAAAAELSADDVRTYLAKMLDTAKPYGPDWVSQTRMTALRALTGKPALAQLALDVAAEADKSLDPNASTDDQAAITSLYANAAKLAGKADLAASLEAKSAKLELKLDSEYNEKVPPFKPASFAGRKNPSDDRVVVMELFTGAQCPPCVAADVGFDALLKTYKPTELVALQYHLHIPGPDPLTNPASLGRAEYYGVRSTPSTFFGGELDGQGGGSMPQSEAKYNQYRNIIDERLYGTRIASLDLNVKRTGDSIQIAAMAKADLAEFAAQRAKDLEKPQQSDDAAAKKAVAAKKGSVPKKGAVPKKDAAKKVDATNDDANKDDDEAKKQQDEPKLKLYLAVTQENVRYVGSNKIRFHHHLVRAFAGGNDGTAMSDGTTETKLSISLDDIRQEIGNYLEKYQTTGSFPNPLPPVDLKGLSIVAFVQDDTSKKILHAVAAPVPDAK